jgi:hypothetical protein
VWVNDGVFVMRFGVMLVKPNIAPKAGDSWRRTDA